MIYFKGDTHGGYRDIIAEFIRSNEKCPDTLSPDDL